MRQSELKRWPGKPSKMRNVKVTTKDGRFDSKRELKRWEELKLLEKAGKITGLRRQVKYTLIPRQERDDGSIERECSYIADFQYEEAISGHKITEDVKGMLTPVYKLKRKLMLHFHGITIREVK